MTQVPPSTESGQWVETAHMKIRKEGPILYCVFKECPNVTLEIAKHCVQQRVAFSAGVSYPCLIDMRDLKSATAEARAYMGVGGAAYITAGALLIGSPVTKMIANLFLMMNKPPVPTRMFTDEKAAREWLIRNS